jgi:hypothetical protein
MTHFDSRTISVLHNSNIIFDNPTGGKIVVPMTLSSELCVFEQSRIFFVENFLKASLLQSPDHKGRFFRHCFGQSAA